MNTKSTPIAIIMIVCVNAQLNAVTQLPAVIRRIVPSFLRSSITPSSIVSEPSVIESSKENCYGHAHGSALNGKTHGDALKALADILNISSCNPDKIIDAIIVMASQSKQRPIDILTRMPYQDKSLFHELYGREMEAFLKTFTTRLTAQKQALNVTIKSNLSSTTATAQENDENHGLMLIKIRRALDQMSNGDYESVREHMLSNPSNDPIITSIMDIRKEAERNGSPLRCKILDSKLDLGDARLTGDY